MTDRTLRDCRILVVEDEYMLADDLCGELADAGAIVVGPAATIADALALVGDAAVLHGAILDANLGGDPVYPVADLLAARGVPIVFTTGYDAAAIPARFRLHPRCEKPVSMKTVTQAIGRLLNA